jgi:hypothetical protein
MLKREDIIMKHWLCAAAMAPLLIACASVEAREIAETANASSANGSQVLIVNGQRITLDRGGDAAAAIEQALARSGDDRVHIELELEDGDHWSEARRDAFASAMAALASGLAEDALVVAFSNGATLDFDFDTEGGLDERDHDRMARDADRMARHAERLARRAEVHGRSMELAGLEAGLAGLRAGLAGIDRSLERGWADEAGARRALTDEDREELEEARAGLAVGLEEMRAQLAEARGRSIETTQDTHREIRIVRRDGEVRAWVNGEEATGSELDRLLAEDEAGLAGAPRPPEPPREPPREPAHRAPEAPEPPQPPRD